MRFPGAGGPIVMWDWDGTLWRRGQNNSVDATIDGGQISAANVIFQYVNYPIVGYQKEGNGLSPIPMPADRPGRCHRPFRWNQDPGPLSKPTDTAVTQYTDANGTPIGLTPGQTWIELVPVGTALNTK